MLNELTIQLKDRQDLSADQVKQAVEALTRDLCSAEEKAEFLMGLARKGETVEEISAFARTLREKAVPFAVDDELRARAILDVVGTGGDKLGTFNISTCAALVASAAGIVVAKHGNRAITSKTGSADVLEALGVPIDLTPEEAARWLKEHGFVFLFAPLYHPAFKHIGPARKLCAEHGRRTVFNYLGPLLNPARPSAQLMGVPRPDLCEPLARVLQSLGVRHGMVVCGEVPDGRGTRHMDEISILGQTTVAEFQQDRGFHVSSLSIGDLPIPGANLEDLLGGTPDQNAETVRKVLMGEERGPKRHAVLLNSAAAIFVGERAESIKEGWDIAEELIDSGKVRRRLSRLARRA